MEFYLIILLLILILPVFSWYYYTRYSRLGYMMNKIQGPNGFPIIGNALSFQTSLVKVFEQMREWNETYYPVNKIWVFHKPAVNIRHPDDLEILLSSTKQIDKEIGYELLHPWLQTGLVTGSGKKWQNRRRILTPAFHFNILKKYYEMTNEEVQRSMFDIKDKKEVNLEEFYSQHNLHIICESAMGVALDDNTNKTAAVKYIKAIYTISKITMYRMVRPYLRDWMIPLLPKLHKAITTALKDSSDFTNAIIRERRNYHENSNYKFLDEMYEDEKSESDNMYVGKKKRSAMLDLLLDAEQKNLIDDKGIKEEVATFIFAGHDTTAAALAFTTMLLAENEEIQDRARKEVEEIMTKNNGKLNIPDLQELNYLERCIKESIRLYPPVPMISRHLNEDMKFKHCSVPKGVDVFMHIIDVHRDPNFWPEPTKFDPDRFLPENIRQRHSFAYIPFSAGPRNCIGQKFAMMELKSFLSHVLYNFHLKPIDFTRDIVFASDILLRPSKPVHTKFIKINR